MTYVPEHIINIGVLKLNIWCTYVPKLFMYYVHISVLSISNNCNDGIYLKI